MSGRKQFDESKALEAAMQLFWRKGYEATSLSELETATGLNKSSIYNTFQNKEHLYALCLQLFSDKHSRAAVQQLEHPDFLTALQQFYDFQLQGFDDNDLPNGCLVTMAALEMGGSDKYAAKVVNQGMEYVRSHFEKRCLQGIVDQQLAADSDCLALSAMLLAMTRGIAVLNRGYNNSDMARKSITAMLKTLA